MLTKATKDKLNGLITAVCDEGLRDIKAMDSSRLEALARLVEAVHVPAADSLPVVGFIAQSPEGDDE